MTQLALLNSAEAVSVIRRVSRSKIIPHRLLALKALPTMSTPRARTCLAGRVSILSRASQAEKELAKSLLTGSSPSWAIPHVSPSTARPTIGLKWQLKLCNEQCVVDVCNIIPH